MGNFFPSILKDLDISENLQGFLLYCVGSVSKYKIFWLIHLHEGIPAICYTGYVT